MTDTTDATVYERMQDDYTKTSPPPVALDKIDWRPDGKPNDGQCRYVAYIDARHAAEILDQWAGPLNWKVDYKGPERWEEDEPQVMWASISVRDENGEWVAKPDVGKATQFESEKGLVSDAFKRAAVAWGVGRNLYDLPVMWAQCKTGSKGQAFKHPNADKEIMQKLKSGGHDRPDEPSEDPRDPDLVTDEQWQQLKTLGAAAKEMFGGEWDRTREALLDGRTVSWDTTTTGDAALLIADFVDLVEGEPFDVQEPVSGTQPVLESPTPRDRGEPVSESEEPPVGSPEWIAWVQLRKKPKLVELATKRELDTAGTAQDLRARIIAAVS